MLFVYSLSLMYCLQICAVFKHVLSSLHAVLKACIMLRYMRCTRTRCSLLTRSQWSESLRQSLNERPPAWELVFTEHPCPECHGPFLMQKWDLSAYDWCFCLQCDILERPVPGVGGQAIALPYEPPATPESRPRAAPASPPKRLRLS